MRPRAEFHGRQAGFTLMETLVSLALLGMAGALVVAGLGGAHQVWSRTNARGHGAEAVETAQALLRLRLESLIPATRYDGGPAYADLAGLPATLTFVAPPGDAAGPGGPRRHTLGLAANGNLVLSSVADAAPNAGGRRRDEVLLNGVQSLELAYFGAAPPDNGRAWRGAWQHRPAPPQLIRIRVRFPPGDRRWWPDQIVRPRADVDTDCALDSDGDRCRGR